MQAIIQTIASWINALLAWFARVFEWLLGLGKDFLEFFADLPILILSGFLDGAIYLLTLIPVPDFLAGASLQAAFNGLSGDVLYLVNFFGIPPALGAMGAGVVFRLTRKALTLGQW